MNVPDGRTTIVIADTPASTAVGAKTIGGTAAATIAVFGIARVTKSHRGSEMTMPNAGVGGTR
jgi:hypothetical protein